MATAIASPAPSLPLYRMDAGTYNRLVAAGAMEGLDVELRDGLLLDRHARGEDAIHRLDVETYNRMVDTGALEGEPVELLDGLLVEMSPQGDSHVTLIALLTRHFRMAQAWLMVQLPLETSGRSKPEPDLALIRDGSRPNWRCPGAALLVVGRSLRSTPRPACPPTGSSTSPAARLRCAAIPARRGMVGACSTRSASASPRRRRAWRSSTSAGCWRVSAGEVLAESDGQSASVIALAGVTARRVSPPAARRREPSQAFGRIGRCHR
jgi:Putative restriction endonuclease